VEKGERLVTISYNSTAKLDEAKSRIAAAFTFSETKTEGKKLIRRLIGA
jgi:thymidine phosphorylase